MFNNLKRELKNLHVTQRELAGVLGCTPTTMLLKFKGETDWKLSEMRAVQRYLNQKQFDKSAAEGDTFFCPNTLEYLFHEDET